MPGLRLLILFILYLFASLLLKADSLRILFVYGSKPKTEGEGKWFGGIHGGHVSVEYKDGYVSFVPSGKFHIFPKDSFHSEFAEEKGEYFIFDTLESRYMMISIPVSSDQKRNMDSVLTQRLKKPPYDYAFFGMRCASSAYELLAAAGIKPKMSIRKMTRRYFYPKLLRKRLLKEAKSKGWTIIYRPGRKTRKWEKD